MLEPSSLPREARTLFKEPAYDLGGRSVAVSLCLTGICQAMSRGNARNPCIRNLKHLWNQRTRRSQRVYLFVCICHR